MGEDHEFYRIFSNYVHVSALGVKIVIIAASLEYKPSKIETITQHQLVNGTMPGRYLCAN